MLKIISYSIIITLFLGLSYCFAENSAVKADQIYDLKSAIVWYDLASKSGEIVRIQVQYDSATPQSRVYDVYLAPLEPKTDGSYTFYCAASEGGNVMFTFDVNNRSITRTKIDTDYRPKSSVGKEEKAFLLKSKGGYEVLFTFSFDKGNMANVNIKPKVNPFLVPGQNGLNP